MSKKVIEFRFDGDTESRIRALVASLGERLPAPPMKLVRQPHISLAVFDDAEAEPLIRTAESLAGQCRWAIATRIAGVGAFPSEQRAIFLLPTVTAAMLVLHDLLHRELGHLGERCWAYYRPGEWTPHCTLASGAPAEHVGTALEFARTHFAFGPTTLASIAVRDLDIDRDVATFPLLPIPPEAATPPPSVVPPTLDVRPGLRLRPARVEDAEELFALTDANRAYLRQWLPWLDGTRSADDTRAFLRGARGRVWVVQLDGRAAGVCGFNWVQPANLSCEIGYWLAADAQGRGVMTDCVRRLVAHAFDDLGLNRVTIPAAAGNARSRAIPRRLGFRNEGVLREAERLYERWVDHVLYATTRAERPTIEGRSIR